MGFRADAPEPIVSKLRAALRVRNLVQFFIGEIEILVNGGIVAMNTDQHQC